MTLSSGKIDKIECTDILSYPQDGIRFGFCSIFLLPHLDWKKNVIVFGVDSSSSMDVINMKKYILVLSEAPVQELNCKC